MPVCPECGQNHSLADLEIAAEFPDAVTDIPVESLPGRITVSPAGIVLDGQRYFVRGVIPLPVPEARTSYRVGAWAEVSVDAFKAVLAAQTKRAGVSVAGHVANRLSFAPGATGAEVRISANRSEEVPSFLFEGVQDHDLAVCQRDGVAGERILEWMRPMIHGDVKLTDQDRVAHRLAQRAVLLSGIRRSVGSKFAEPASDLPLDRFLALAIELGAPRTRPPAYVAADDANEAVAGIEAVAPGMASGVRPMVAVLLDLDAGQSILQRELTPLGRPLAAYAPDDLVDVALHMMAWAELAFVPKGNDMIAALGLRVPATDLEREPGLRDALLTGTAPAAPVRLDLERTGEDTGRLAVARRVAKLFGGQFVAQKDGDLALVLTGSDAGDLALFVVAMMAKFRDGTRQMGGDLGEDVAVTQRSFAVLAKLADKSRRRPRHLIGKPLGADEKAAVFGAQRIFEERRALLKFKADLRDVMAATVAG